MADDGMVLERLDHLVLTVTDIEATWRFYARVMGMRRESFGEGRVALHFGRQKINLHPHPSPIEPKARNALPGTADLCFVAETPLAAVIGHLESCGVEIELGPVPTTGAEGPMRSIYFRDPDGNLIEIANYASASAVPKA